MKKVFFMFAFVACMAFVACNGNSTAEIVDTITEDSMVENPTEDTLMVEDVIEDTFVVE